MNHGPDLLQAARGSGYLPSRRMETRTMKHVELGELVSAVPLSPAKMTRCEKLKHWAALIRKADRPVWLYNALEYMSSTELRRTRIGGEGDATALAIAASDPVFQAQGLNATTSIADALRFFELSISQAHAFSCDCGGAISNDQQADRIERLA